MQGTSNHTSRLNTRWFLIIALLEIVTIVAGILLVFSSSFAHFSILCSIIAVLIALYYTPLRRFLLEVVIVASLIVVVWTIIQASPLLSSPQPGTIATTQTFLFSTDKLLSDVNSLTSNQKVRVTLIVNGEEYHYDAKFIQKPVTKNTATIPLPDKTVSVTLEIDNKNMMDNFIAQLPDVTTIYILPEQ